MWQRHAAEGRGAVLSLDQVRVLVAGLDHPEGVTVDADGTLYAGGEAGQVYRVDVENGTAEQVADAGGFLLGLCADDAGRLYVCNVGERVVQRVDPRTGSVEVWSRGAAGRPLVNPNWPVFTADGVLLVTDSGSWMGDDGCILRVEPSGETSVWTTETSNFPNGACLTPEGDALLVLESCTPALVRVPISADGSAGPREVVAELPGTVPDGVTVTEDGTAYVCCYRPDRILAVRPDGKVEVLVDDPRGTVLSAPTNGVWLEPQRTRLVTGNLGRWHLSVLEPGGVGVPLRYGAVPR